MRRLTILLAVLSQTLRGRARVSMHTPSRIAAASRCRWARFRDCVSCCRDPMYLISLGANRCGHPWGRRGRPWTRRGDLRIRRLGVRVPPGVPRKPLPRRPSVRQSLAQGPIAVATRRCRATTNHPEAFPHGRGHWFDPSGAHPSGPFCFRRRFSARGDSLKRFGQPCRWSVTSRFE